MLLTGLRDSAFRRTTRNRVAGGIHTSESELVDLPKAGMTLVTWTPTLAKYFK